MSSDRTQHESFLSDQIKELLLISAGEKQTKQVNWLDNRGEINWTKVAGLFANCIVPHNEQLTYDHCQAVTEKFHTFLASIPPIPFKPENLRWTNRLTLLEITHNLSCGSDNLTATLILTSVLEYALGNVYQTLTGQVPPHLLRDLLMTETLVEFLGPEKIYLMRLLLGTPNGTNLRNLLWHGFPALTEIDNSYRNFLFGMLSSIGQTFNRIGFQLKWKSCSINVSDLMKQMELETVDLKKLESALQDHELINGNQLDIWMKAFEFYRSGNYYFCTSLVLPQLEMFLRRLYGGLYQWDYRAKIDEYYIIMDTIFGEKDSTGNRNRTYDCFSQSLLELSYDLMSAVAGSRLRDKLSHGELDYGQVDQTVADGVLGVSYLLVTNDRQYRYSSIFHPNALLVSRLDECERSWEKCSEISIPPDLIDERKSMVEDDVPFIPDIQLLPRGSIFKRPQREDEMVGFLQRISNVLRQAMDNFRSSLVQKLHALERRELRSRGRKTLQRMVRMLPAIGQALEFVLKLVRWMFYYISQADEIRAVDSVIRFMKIILKYTENAANNLDAGNNVWQPLYETTRRELYPKTRQYQSLLLS
ncbi:endoplasmic reticulum membrane-associated RNA degradation protein-like [Uranotaenia lowii]|uniref:endoplasmic reticulum membrane-associated RNA degradation protein-like n=1 Tax=Uranotaenia lowii TaxID=190385 RepID=UPI00247A390E|nr:endoplasmic reticulum membrane-associated RNA degradation protein-like [Uranotaenia lowii]